MSAPKRSPASTVLDSVRISSLAQELYKCVKNDLVVQAKFLLKELTPDNKRRIASITFDGNTPLFVAAHQGLVHMVNFLLDDCHADVEQCGVYEVQEDRSNHVVSALWCAAVSNKLEVVRTLIKHGANVNTLSDTCSTPVRSACYMTNIDVVKCLVDNGANIHHPNVNGGTCLINSVQSMELCKYLIEKGAELNAQDNSGNLALHYAVREGRMETVKLLLKYGSLPYTKNDLGDDALQTACLRGHSNIMSYLIQQIKPSIERQIEAHELIGTNFVDEKHDIQSTIHMWRVAMSLRLNGTDHHILVDTPTEPSPAYNNAVEPRSMEDLDHIIHEPDAVYMQALRIRERILGADHKDTIFGLMYRGAVYADIPDYHRCIDLWKYAFKLRHAKQEPLNHECLFTLQALCKLFWEIREEHALGQTSQSLKYDDIIDVIKMAINEITCARHLIAKQAAQTGSTEAAKPLPFKLVSNEPLEPMSKKQQKEEYHVLLQLLLHLIHIVCKLNKTEEQLLEFYQLVHQCVSQNPVGNHGKTLLHLATDKATSVICEEVYSQFPNESVVELLLKCGASVDVTDNNHNTPLHIVVDIVKREHLLDNAVSNSAKHIIVMLLKYDAHIDIRNRDSTVVVDQLNQLTWMSIINIDPLDHITLKCLAARVVKKENIPYEDDIPQSLVPFIEMH